MQPRDGPNIGVVRHKRNYAFDLGGKAYITVSNINLFATTITTDPSSDHVIVLRLR